MASHFLLSATCGTCGGALPQQLAQTKAVNKFLSHRVFSCYGGRPKSFKSVRCPSFVRRKNRNSCKGLKVIAEANGDTASMATEIRNPQTIEEAISQARRAVQNAIADGLTRQQVQFLLPVDQRQFNYLDTEPRDYPCGIIEEYAACCKVVTSMFKEMTGKGVEIVSRRIGEPENEQDPVGLLYPSSKSVAAIVFPIAESLKQIRSLAEKDRAPLLIVNPQWRSSGQVVSDFGFGPWRRQAEEFLNTFERTFVLLEQRVGEASNIVSGTGGVVRILKCYPRNWEIYLMAWDGSSELISETPTQPSYKELEQIVTEARKRIPWRAPPRIMGGSEPAPPPLPASLSGALTHEQIDVMEVGAVRRALMALGLPSSGRLSVVKERLKNAQKK